MCKQSLKNEKQTGEAEQRAIYYLQTGSLQWQKNKNNREWGQVVAQRLLSASSQSRLFINKSK